MNKILLLLLTIMSLAVLSVTPVSANSSSAINEACDIVYVVQANESLSSIANKCGLNVLDIMRYNPQITDTNMIYRGQVIRLSENADYSLTRYSSLYWLYYYYYNQALYAEGTYSYLTGIYGSAQVNLSTYSAAAGDSITVRVGGFPADAEIDYRIGKSGEGYVRVYDGHTDEDGNAKKTITVPSIADKGERWVVQVVTTDLKTTISAYSAILYIGGGGSNDDDNVRITLSAATAKPGDSITVFVEGFPAEVNIDFLLGRKGKPFSVAYDGETNSDGEAEMVVTIPATAVSGQVWVVKVKTTDLSETIAGVSPEISITD